MVGLPARGKTYMARKLARYLSWLGYDTRVFNVGNYRRERLGSHQPHEFFSPDNPAGAEARLHIAMAALDDMLAWLGSGGEVGIYDATNSSHERRQLVRERCESQGLDVVFIESICDDPAVIDANVRETKLLSPDYSDVDPSDAASDFLARIAHYERAYEPIADDSASYVKLIDVGRQIVINRIRGYLPARVVVLLMNLHIIPRVIWLTRHGESTFNMDGRIGGDSGLSPRGEAYARSLSKLVREELAPDGDFVVWTSTLMRAVQTALPLTSRPIRWRALDEINAGVCDGMTYAEISERMPAEFRARADDKFRYRYPRGESYEDVIQRLDPVIIELERERRPLLIVGHQAVLRALYAYLLDMPPDQCPHVSIPLHTVVELRLKTYGSDERRFPLLPHSGVRDAPSS